MHCLTVSRYALLSSKAICSAPACRLMIYVESLFHDDLVRIRGFELRFVDIACTSSSSGGNQVDGLPPAAHTGEGTIGSAPNKHSWGFYF